MAPARGERSLGSPVDIAHAAILRTRTSLVLEHFLYESPSLYLTAYLHGGGQLGFVRSQWGATGAAKPGAFSSDATYICEHAKSAGVPLVVVFLPNRATVGMISRGHFLSRSSPVD